MPTLVRDISGVGSVSCGSAHTLALSRDGKTVWSFGNGDGGKLGHGDTVRVYKPRVIEALQGVIIKKVCAGHQFSLALTLSGRVSIVYWDILAKSGIFMFLNAFFRRFFHGVVEQL